ncbi:MAG TPA: SCO family protein [Steroidobacteraceae bacterium]|nr:SCO family protein [Steroidobacteraceae bacterium]
MNHPRRLRITLARGLAAAVLGVALTGSAAAYPSAFKAGVFDPPRAAPDFVLQGSDGHELRLSRFRGKVVLLAFGYSSCPEVCPVTLATFAQARRKLGAAAADVQVVYVTVDPERDVPKRLEEFLGAFDSTFIGGTGTEAQLAAVRKAYGVTATKVPSRHGYTYAHSSFTYLLDRTGRIRALMPYGHSPDDFVHDLTILLKE